MIKKTIFIIDDDKDMRKKYKRLLVDAGFDVVQAPNAIEVANILMREKSNIDLILLDINMPQIDGRDIFDIIDEYAPNFGVIVNSVLPVREQKLRIPRAADYYDKSHKPEVLLGKIRKILEAE